MWLLNANNLRDVVRRKVVGGNVSRGRGFFGLSLAHTGSKPAVLKFSVALARASVRAELTNRNYVCRAIHRLLDRIKRGTSAEKERRIGPRARLSSFILPKKTYLMKSETDHRR